MSLFWIISPTLLLLGAAAFPLLRKKARPIVMSSLPKEYLTGLNYLLNEQDDKALEVFIRLLAVDSDTVETHLALGNLFRRRGEVDRAIRIHQNLIARPQLATYERTMALVALGKDYLKAGVLDRAERIFIEVVKMKSEQLMPSLQFLVEIYQQEKAWEKGIKVATELKALGHKDILNTIAHFYCELVEENLLKKQVNKAGDYLKLAYKQHAKTPRVALLDAKVELMKKNYSRAISAGQRIMDLSPAFLTESLELEYQCYAQLDMKDKFYVYVEGILKKYPKPVIQYVLNHHERFCREHSSIFKTYFWEYIFAHPSLSGMLSYMNWSTHQNQVAGSSVADREKMTTALKTLSASHPSYQCQQCGYTENQLSWLCPSCRSWGQIEPKLG